MAERFVLHIGAPKSGTTYLQSVLWANKEPLRGAGLLLPGKARFSHTRAATAVAGRASGRNAQVWSRFVEQTGAWDGTVLVSDEWFVRATTAAVGEALEDLRGTDVHVVFTARDLVRQVPAAWQEELKLGHPASLREFVLALDDPDRKWSWRSLDPAAVLPAWSAHLPADRVHVVTVPPSGAPRDLLWQRFASAVGFDPSVASTETVEANESLGAEAARLLRELGPDLREAVDADTGDWRLQYRWLRRYLGHDVLVPLGGSRIGLAKDLFERTREHAVASAAAVRAAGWDVVGDLADLTAAPFSPEDRDPDTVSPDEMLEVARPLVARLLSDVRRLSDETVADEEG